MVALALLGGCRETTTEPEPAEILTGSLYQLQSGRFTAIPKEQNPVATPLRPWTVQERVSDAVAWEGQVYLGVNGYGIARFISGEDEQRTFTYFYDPLIFRYRTLTTLIPEGDSGGVTLLCHLYFNKLLNVIGQTELKLQGISLIRLIPVSGNYEFCTPPYQEAHPEWEAVGFVPATESEFFLRWKYSDRNRTLFSYSRYELTGVEEEIDALAYRKSYGFEDPLQTDGMKRLLGEARKELDEPGVSTAYQLHLRYQDRPLIERYEYHPDDFITAEEIRLFTLSAAAAGESTLLLLPDGLLLRIVSGTRQVHRLHLPPLPAGYGYTHLLLHDGYLTAGWEQTAFTDVGAAGIFFAELPFIP
jgi:hypothetical protein